MPQVNTLSFYSFHSSDSDQLASSSSCCPPLSPHLVKHCAVSRQGAQLLRRIRWGVEAERGTRMRGAARGGEECAAVWVREDGKWEEMGMLECSAEVMV